MGIVMNESTRIRNGKTAKGRIQQKRLFRKSASQDLVPCGVEESNQGIHDSSRRIHGFICGLWRKKERLKESDFLITRVRYWKIEQKQ